MPELPEVQSVVNYFKPLLSEEKIHKITSPNGYEKVFDTHSFLNINIVTKSLRINDVFRKGKYIVLELSKGYLCIHLRMTGQLQMDIREADSLKHCSFAIFFESGKSVYFRDYRKFGRLYYYKDLDILNDKLGIEPLSDKFDYDYLLGRVKGSNGMIKPFLLNQKHIAGLGNIYIDECLWLSKIHPKKIASRISKPKIRVLSDAIPKILTQAIEFNGTTIINFSYGNQVTGDFKQFLNVFGKQGEACPRCKTILKKIFVSQRGTHYCPKCQKV
tara:strand:+ start:3514 stop:4332 length:819 start_codon:yes stop_codon:yes gene_type:complete